MLSIVYFLEDVKCLIVRAHLITDRQEDYPLRAFGMTEQIDLRETHELMACLILSAGESTLSLCPTGLKSNNIAIPHRGDSWNDGR